MCGPTAGIPSGFAGRMLKWYKVVNERAGHDDLMDLGGKVERALNDHDVEEKSKEERHETLGSRGTITRMSTSSPSN